jgi:hypothetical protein
MGTDSDSDGMPGLVDSDGSDSQAFAKMEMVPRNVSHYVIIRM